MTLSCGDVLPAFSGIPGPGETSLGLLQAASAKPRSPPDPSSETRRETPSSEKEVLRQKNYSGGLNQDESNDLSKHRGSCERSNYCKEIEILMFLVVYSYTVPISDISSEDCGTPCLFLE